MMTKITAIFVMKNVTPNIRFQAKLYRKHVANNLHLHCILQSPSSLMSPSFFLKSFVHTTTVTCCALISLNLWVIKSALVDFQIKNRYVLREQGLLSNPIVKLSFCLVQIRDSFAAIVVPQRVSYSFKIQIISTSDLQPS